MSFYRASVQSCTKAESWEPARVWDYMRYSLSAVLLVAAILKLAHIGSSAPRSGLLDSFPIGMQLGIVQAEIFLAIWLILGGMETTCWWVCILCFAAFAIISGSEALAGHEICGCFGDLRIAPLWVCVLDLGVLTLLVVIRPRLPSRMPRAAFASSLTFPLIASLAVGVAASQMHGGGRTATAFELDRARLGSTVVLHPEEWVGMRLPLLDYVEGAAELSEGDWTIVLVYRQCPTCRKAINRYERRISEIKARRVFFLELGGAGSPIVSSVFPVGRLNTQYRWIAQTPIEIAISSGVVQFVKKPSDLATVSISRRSPAGKEELRWTCS